MSGMATISAQMPEQKADTPAQIAKGCTITEHGTKPAVGSSCNEGRQAEHKLGTNDTHGHPHTTLLVAGQEHPGCDESDQTCDVDRSSSDQCCVEIVERISGVMGSTGFKEQVQKAEALKAPQMMRRMPMTLAALEGGWR